MNGTIINGNYNTDSFCISHPVSSIQTQYYLVVDFRISEATSYYAYNYKIQLGYTNDQPLPAIVCVPGTPPYQGELDLDTDTCYSVTNSYHLPLSILNDDPGAQNYLIGVSNQSTNYLPISDFNGNGFVVTLKNQVTNYSGYYYGQTIESFEAFNTFPYTYSTNIYSDYTVAFTVTMKNDTAAEGLKGFRLQFPNLTLYNNASFPSFPANGAPGIYDPTGTWSVLISGDIITWIFNGANGRGDNVTDTGYSCRVYNFSVHVGHIGNAINAWYLPDEYGADSIECGYGPSIPPRTDCGSECGNTWYSQNWIPIHPGGSGGGSLGITGVIVPCNNNNDYCLGGYETGCGIQYTNYCGYGLIFGQTYTFSSFTFDGCYHTYTIDWEYYNSVFDAPQLPDGGLIDTTICNGTSFMLNLNHNFNSNGVRTVIVYQANGSSNWYPVNSNGTIFPLAIDFSYISLPTFNQLPFYSNSNISISLHVGGTYNLWSYYGNGYDYQGENCNGTLILTVDTVVVNTSIANDTICNMQSVNIISNGSNTYTWSPNYAISSTTGSFVVVNPSFSTTYTVTGTDGLGCTDNSSVIIIVYPGILDTAAASFGSLQSRYCPNSSPVTLIPVNQGGIFSGPGITGNVFNPQSVGIGGPYIISYSFGNCASNSHTTMVENPDAAISPSASIVQACFNQPIPLTTPYDPYYTYLWKRGPFVIPGAVSNSFTPIWSGAFKYTVKVTDTYGGGCVSKDSVYYHLINFPNPTLIIGPCINNTIELNSSVTDPNLNYQWVKWGTPISGATYTSYTVTTNGAYRVAITDSCGTLRFTPLTQINVSTCRVEELTSEQTSQMLEVLLYPNPNDGQFLLELNTFDFSSEEISVQIFNLLGQMVYQKNMHLSDGKLNTTIQLPVNVESGLYNVRIKKGEFETNRKVVISK